MTKEELLAGLDRVLSSPNLIHYQGEKAALAYWMAEMLDQYALSIVEQSVPEKKELEGAAMSTDAEYDLMGKGGFNSCRDQTLEKARKLTSHA